MEGVGVNYTTRKPIGIVGCISPWNLPLYLFSWKIAPALAAGNCVIAKPSEITPYTAYLLGEVCTEAGMPPGVLNILHGLGSTVGDAIVKHPKIKAVSFTGGTATGEYIARTAAPMFKKLSLELGGKNPNIIFADCDFDDMISTTVRSSFANQGQICLCGSRIFVERSIYEKFKAVFVEKISKSLVSYPSNPKTHLGAVVSKPHMEKVLSYIESKYISLLLSFSSDCSVLYFLDNTYFSQVVSIVSNSPFNISFDETCSVVVVLLISSSLVFSFSFVYAFMKFSSKLPTIRSIIFLLMLCMKNSALSILTI
jgi:aminomuconate-semialdehyde/2-hydroxymuconate-6-semialdehyde dehydrogenase